MWAAVLDVNEDLLAQCECEALVVASNDEDGGKDGEGERGNGEQRPSLGRLISTLRPGIPRKNMSLFRHSFPLNSASLCIWISFRVFITLCGP